MLAIPELPADPDHALVILVGVMVMGLMGTLTFAVKSFQQSRATNAAVNHVGVGEPSISQNVAHIRSEVDRLAKIQDDFNAKGWQALPDDLTTAPALTQTIRDLQSADAAQVSDHETIMAKLEAMDRAIAEHIRWEVEVKHADDDGG